MQELFLWISKIIILTYPGKSYILGRWLGMAVNIYSHRRGGHWEGPPPSQTPGSGRVGNFCSLRTYYKSALRALEALLSKKKKKFFLAKLSPSAEFVQLDPRSLSYCIMRTFSCFSLNDQGSSLTEIRHDCDHRNFLISSPNFRGDPRMSSSKPLLSHAGSRSSLKSSRSSLKA